MWLLFGILAIPSLTDELEAVQNRSCGFILSNYHRTSSITTMKTTLSLHHWSTAGNNSVCAYSIKYIMAILLIRKDLNNPSNMWGRVDHRFKVGISSCHTKCFDDPFLPSVFVKWNLTATCICRKLRRRALYVWVSRLYEWKCVCIMVFSYTDLSSVHLFMYPAQVKVRCISNVSMGICELSTLLEWSWVMLLLTPYCTIA